MSTNRSAGNLDTLLAPRFSFGDPTEFDFSLLFEDTILAIVPASLFLLAAFIRIYHLGHGQSKVSASATRQLKLVSGEPSINSLKVAQTLQGT